tara:strand:+ start:13324 stop:13506 length:183 start_codon:yes stop_codon:yes gene_type:complete
LIHAVDQAPLHYRKIAEQLEPTNGTKHQAQMTNILMPYSKEVWDDFSPLIQGIKMEDRLS